MPYRGRVFEALGLQEEEERLYVAMLERSDAPVKELGEAVGANRAALRRSLGTLEREGFITRASGKSQRWIPVPPDVAVDALAVRRQQEIEVARQAALSLSERLRTSFLRTRPSEVVEVLDGREEVAQQFEQIQRAVREELLILDRPPYAGPPNNELELEVLGRKVRCRTIYHAEALEVPGKLEWVRQTVEAGEVARTLADLPTKLALADSRLALIPINFHQVGAEGALLVHASSLLETLRSFFELLWRTATPLRLEGQAGLGEGRPSAVRTQTLSLLAAGMKDESIARALGISRSTVDRRIRELMRELGARTRFQAGMAAERQGAFEPEPEAAGGPDGGS